MCVCLTSVTSVTVSHYQSFFLNIHFSEAFFFYYYIFSLSVTAEYDASRHELQSAPERSSALAEHELIFAQLDARVKLNRRTPATQKRKKAATVIAKGTQNAKLISCEIVQLAGPLTTLERARLHCDRGLEITSCRGRGEKKENNNEKDFASVRRSSLGQSASLAQLLICPPQ